MRLIASPRQRRPTYAIGLDVGGTKIAGGVVNADGDVIERLDHIPSPATDRNATLTAIQGAVTGLRSRHPDIVAVGVGAAGLVEWPDGHIRWAPNNAYADLPLRQILEHTTSLAAIVDNDANVAGWAEARLGSHASNLAFLTVGTGLGGGLILDGRMFRGHTGLGAEVGHLIVDPTGGQQCGCGNVGCLEALASGSALRRYGRKAATADPGGLMATLAGGAANVTGEIVLAAAQEADPAAVALFDRVGYWLGVGIASLVNLFEFEVIVIGGGVAAAGDLLLVPARASLSHNLFGRAYREMPEIVSAQLGPDAGWIGAGILALDELGHAPAASRSLPTAATGR